MKRLRDEIAALNAKLDILDPRNTGPTEAQKIKMAESGLRVSRQCEQEIAELETKIKTNDLSRPCPPQRHLSLHPTIAQRRKELEAKRNTRDKLLDNSDEFPRSREASC